LDCGQNALFFYTDAEMRRQLEERIGSSARVEIQGLRPYDHRSNQFNCGSEADGVIRNFKMLSPLQVQDILNFLRSL
jgi:hypothetical protein